MPASPSPSTANTVEPSSKEEDDTAELARFRQEWLTELNRHKPELSGTVTTGPGNGTTDISAESTSPLSSTKDLTGQIFKENESLEATSSREVIPNRRNLTTHPALNEDDRIAPSFQISKALESALNIYRRAVAHEQQGEFDQAILLYRQAFHLVCGRVFENGVQPCLRFI
jgi:F-box protein 9